MLKGEKNSVLLVLTDVSYQ